MTEDQLAVNRNAITLQGGRLDLDVLIPDINWCASLSAHDASNDDSGTLTLKIALPSLKDTMSPVRPTSHFRPPRISNLTWTIRVTVLTLVPQTVSARRTLANSTSVLILAMAQSVPRMESVP